MDEGDAAADVRALRRSATRALAGADVLLISDHDLGVLHDGLIGGLCRLRPSLPIVVESGRAERYRPLAATVLAVDMGQARAVAGGDMRLDRLARRVRHHTAAATVVVTVSGHGAYLLSDEPPGELMAAGASFAASEGAPSDSFAATLALAIGAGAELEKALASRWAASGGWAGDAVMVPLSAVSNRRAGRASSALANSGPRGGERSSDQSTETADSPPGPLCPAGEAGDRRRPMLIRSANTDEALLVDARAALETPETERIEVPAPEAIPGPDPEPVLVPGEPVPSEPVPGTASNDA